MIPRARREAVQQAARHETLPADHRRISRLALRESAKTRLAELDRRLRGWWSDRLRARWPPPATNRLGQVLRSLHGQRGNREKKVMD